MFVLSINYQKYDSFLKMFCDVSFTNGLPSLGKFISDSLDVIIEFIIIKHAITATHKTGGLEYSLVGRLFIILLNSSVVMGLLMLLISLWFDFGSLDESRHDPFLFDFLV